MSLSLRYLGVPPDSGLIELLFELAETNPEAAEGFQFIPSWLGNSPPGPKGGGWTKDDPAVAWCARMLARDPGFVSRHADLGTWFDMLHYMLSDWRRGEKTDTRFDDLIGHAFWRSRAIDPELKSARGAPYQHIHPLIVAELGARLETLDFADIRANFDAAAMDQKMVYKIHPDTSAAYAAERLAGLEQVYGKFRGFFVEAGRRGESVMVFLG